MCVAGLSLGLAAAAHADCKNEVDQAFSKLRGGTSFRVETTIVHEKQGTLEMTVDYVLPDRMHQRVKLGDNPAMMETIAIGDKVWTNQGQGWTEVPQNFAEAITAQLKQQVSPPTQNKTDYECLGKTEFEGTTYLAYKGRLSVPQDEQVKGEQKKETAPDNVQTVYVDTKTGLPVRNIVTEGDSDKRVFDSAFSTPSNIEIDQPPA